MLENRSKKTTFEVLRAQAGDRRALDDLLKGCQVQLYRYLSSLLEDPLDAEDAVQMTFLQVCRKLPSLRDTSLFRPWIFRIAARIAYRIRNRRHRRSRPTVTDHMDELPDTTSAVDLDDFEVKERLPELLEALTPKCREVVVLHYLDEFTVPEVAAILEIPVGTAKSRLSYALTCLRKTTTKYRGDGQ
jgi:RNA polymerase sigma-70 factor (ECF subfamily)